MTHDSSVMLPINTDGTHQTTLDARELGQHTTWCDGQLDKKPDPEVHGRIFTMVGCRCAGHVHVHDRETGVFTCLATCWDGDYHPLRMKTMIQMAIHKFAEEVARTLALRTNTTQTGPALPTDGDDVIPLPPGFPVLGPKERLN